MTLNLGGSPPPLQGEGRGEVMMELQPIKNKRTFNF
jgi:hypothetical protein